MDQDNDTPGVEEDARDFLLDDTLTEADERAITAAEEAIRDGRVISNEAMMRWIGSWGTDNELPPPQCGG